MQEKLQYHHAVSRQIFLEVVDVLVSLFPNIFSNQFFWQALRFKQLFMYAHDQNLFVIRPVEKAKFAALWNRFMGSPQKFVIEFLLRRRLECRNAASLRIDPGHHMLDGAVFSGGVHRLEDQQQRPAVLRVQLFLKMGKKFHPAL